MTEQRRLFPVTIGERFEAFHEANPEVYRLLRKFALQALHLGFKRYSISTLYEVIRWRQDTATFEPTPHQMRVKLNNDYRAHYARKLLEEVPELPNDFFQLRTIKE